MQKIPSVPFPTERGQVCRVSMSAFLGICGLVSMSMGSRLDWGIVLDQLSTQGSGPSLHDSGPNAWGNVFTPARQGSSDSFGPTCNYWNNHFSAQDKRTNAVNLQSGRESRPAAFDSSKPGIADLCQASSMVQVLQQLIHGRGRRASLAGIFN